MVEKTKAQLRNEAEVARIMRERGISTSSKPKKRKASFEVRPGLIVAFVICAAGVAAFFTNGFGLIKDDSSNTKSQIKEESAEMTAYKAEITALRNCLSEISTEDIPLDDSDFWNKHIARYEAKLKCYDDHPGIVGDDERNRVESSLAKAKESSANELANEQNYRQQLAAIEAESQAYYAKLDQEMAKHEAETEQWLTDYDKQRAELDAKYAAEDAQRAAEENARKQAEELAAAQKEAKCNEYKALYGDKTAEQLAESDPEVSGAKARWTSSQKKVRNCTTSRTQSQRDLCESYRSQELATVQENYSNYISLLSQKQIYYTNLRINSCGY